MEAVFVLLGALCTELTIGFRMIDLDSKDAGRVRKVYYRTGCRMQVHPEASVRTGDYISFLCYFSQATDHQYLFSLLKYPVPLPPHLLKSHTWQQVLSPNPNPYSTFPLPCQMIEQYVFFKDQLTTFTLDVFSCLFNLLDLTFPLHFHLI